MGEIAVRNKGTSITAGRMREIATDAGEVTVFAAGSTVVNAMEADIPQKDVVRVPGIIVKSRGYIGFEYCEKPFTHKSELWSYSNFNAEVNQKFIFHYLVTQSEKLQALARSKSVKLPQLSVADTDKLLVPIPDLEEQKRITEILDKFDEMTTGITIGLPAEIEARRKQYEYYREKLLTFKELAA